MWSIWTSTLAWPSQVTLGVLCRALSRSHAPSFGDQHAAPPTPGTIAPDDAPQEERQGDAEPGALEGLEVGEAVGGVVGRGSIGKAVDRSLRLPEGQEPEHQGHDTGAGARAGKLSPPAPRQARREPG